MIQSIYLQKYNSWARLSLNYWGYFLSVGWQNCFIAPQHWLLRLRFPEEKTVSDNKRINGVSHLTAFLLFCLFLYTTIFIHLFYLLYQQKKQFKIDIGNRIQIVTCGKIHNVFSQREQKWREIHVLTHLVPDGWLSLYPLLCALKFPPAAAALPLLAQVSPRVGGLLEKEQEATASKVEEGREVKCNMFQRWKWHPEHNWN